MAYNPFTVGSATMALGEVIVPDTKLLSTSKILLSNIATVGTIGITSVRITAGSSFTINSSNVLDSSTITYLVIY